MPSVLSYTNSSCSVRPYYDIDLKNFVNVGRNVSNRIKLYSKHCYEGLDNEDELVDITDTLDESSTSSWDKLMHRLIEFADEVVSKKAPAHFKFNVTNRPYLDIMRGFPALVRCK